MEKVDLVIIGAEGVVESGGIINKVCFSESGACITKQAQPSLWINIGGFWITGVKKLVINWPS